MSNFEALDDAGLLSKEKLLAGVSPTGLACRVDEEEKTKADVAKGWW